MGRGKDPGVDLRVGIHGRDTPTGEGRSSRVGPTIGRHPPRDETARPVSSHGREFLQPRRSKASVDRRMDTRPVSPTPAGHQTSTGGTGPRRYPHRPPQSRQKKKPNDRDWVLEPRERDPLNTGQTVPSIRRPSRQTARPSQFILTPGPGPTSHALDEDGGVLWCRFRTCGGMESVVVKPSQELKI